MYSCVLYMPFFSSSEISPLQNKPCKYLCRLFILFKVGSRCTFSNLETSIGKTDRCLGLRLDEHSHAETSAVGKHLNILKLGNTDRCLGLRLDEHSHAETSAVGKHLNECEHFHFIVNLYNISIFSDLDQAVIQHYNHIHAAVLQNTLIIDKNITTGLSFICSSKPLLNKVNNLMGSWFGHYHFTFNLAG